MKVQNHNTMDSLTTRWLISFGFLAILIIGGLLWSEYQLVKQENDSRVVNISGRQRMLSQKISKVVAELTARPDAETSARLVVELEDALTLWEHSQNALRFGDASLGITSDNSPTINYMYADLDLIYEQILNSGRVIITLVQSGRAESEEFSRAASEILLIESSFLASMNDIVFAHDSEASVRVTQSRIIVLSINILLLLFLVFFWFLLIHPALRKAQEVDKAKTEFVFLASHQLRTPLSSTKWLIETMQRKVLGPVTLKQKEYLDEIYQVNERMIKLVFDMLNVLRLESGSVVVKKETILILDFYEELSITMESAVKSKGIILRNVLKNHKMIAVESDITILRSILECFVSNAINYSSSGQEIILDAKEESTAVVFFVKDSGIGIPKEEQKRIFERFYRASNAKVMKPEGTGLGLYIASMLAEKIGAEILFDSEENKGSIFYLRVPKKT